MFLNFYKNKNVSCIYDLGLNRQWRVRSDCFHDGDIFKIGCSVRFRTSTLIN